ncbi:hypothetical protein [Flagellimonas beolgyonensis]|uniref:hypothetical protein n=1 Tax=Flagellimonas beolgyonensis TaxID=864064 RepID=UPI003D65E677
MHQIALFWKRIVGHRPNGMPIFLVCMLLGITLSCSQELPESIQNIFSSKFLNSRDVVWHRAPRGHWLVSFYMERFGDMTASYTPDGELEYFELQVQGDDIPLDLLEKAKHAYPEANHFEVFERNGKMVSYIVELEDHGQHFGIIFFDNGDSSMIPPYDFRFASRTQIDD